MTIVVTGAAGFIGANIVAGLNRRGITDIIAVDDLTDGAKCVNLADLHISDYVDASRFYDRFSQKAYGHIDAVFHQGACSDTMQTDGRYMMENNYSLSCQLFEACRDQHTRLFYASSAATYGNSTRFEAVSANERPLNVYGYSKLLFDQRLRHLCGVDYAQSPVQLVGFRYFNVYGPREQHKGRMASVAFHQYHQFRKDGQVKLFGAYGGYEAGAQVRDFIHVDDVVAINLWFYDRPHLKGLFNLGTGRAEPFNAVALAVIRALATGQHTVASAQDAVAHGHLSYIPFPDALVGKYQCYTQADMSWLGQLGCDHAFSDVAAGVSRYMDWLQRTA
jgi:ADP-L-glycero-D-manno-heptose 6-epimerase